MTQENGSPEYRPVTGRVRREWAQQLCAPGSRNHWQSLIRWMQDIQGLWAFTPKMVDTILDYLAERYGPKADTRRPALPPSLLPSNPYQAPETSESNSQG